LSLAALRGFVLASGRALGAGLAAALCAWLVLQLPFWRHVELRILDALVTRSSPNEVTLPITIIGIDEATFSALGAAWPLPRRYHAALLARLKEAGAAVVGFDVTFPDAQPSREDDRLFARAIADFGAVVLASDLAFREDSAVRQWYRVDPHAMFVDAGARAGYAALQVDEDAVLRRVPTVGDSFWRMLLTELDRLQPGIVARLEASGDMRIRYLGGPQTFPTIPYYKLLEPDRHLPPHWKDFLRDNIVIVGRNLNVISDVGAAQAEVYQTPFFWRTREFMPRVEAHANVVANMVTGQVLREAPAWWAAVAWLIAVALALAATAFWHPWRSAAGIAAIALALGTGSYALFFFRQTWMPVAGALLTLLLVYVAQGAMAFAIERRQRRELRSAFSMYVSPAVVDQIIAQPERLKLGGDRRELTVLFSDLEGFTSISEGLDAEDVSKIVNLHLSEMTAVIQAHGGTVDKFLGDGIMAFWGAPIPDPQHAANAVRAAVAMQDRMTEMGRELRARFGVDVGMRIGLNTGECIVGNMGGNKRFDYTAVGDAVNVAARLEGANKVYGTKILVSASVVAATGAALHFREIDTVRVKGKSVGITVYTPCDDDGLIELSARALARFRAADFPAAELLWRELLAQQAGDPVAPLFLERIRAGRGQTVAGGWDGVSTLETK
jgi:adenylate cyclase